MTVNVLTFNLECEFRSNFNNKKICFVESKNNSNITAPYQIITSVNGQPASNFVNQYFPKGIDNFFPDLEEIHIYNSKLKTIKNHDLKTFRKLEKLILQGNEIESLDNDLFEHYLRLQIFNFHGNYKIKSVEKTFWIILKILRQFTFLLVVALTKTLNQNHKMTKLKPELQIVSTLFVAQLLS